MSLQGLVEAIASGIGTQMLGIILQLAGFDGNAAVQTESALKAVELSVTVLPAVFLRGEDGNWGPIGKSPSAISKNLSKLQAIVCGIGKRVI